MIYIICLFKNNIVFSLSIIQIAIVCNIKEKVLVNLALFHIPVTKV